MYCLFVNIAATDAGCSAVIGIDVGEKINCNHVAETWREESGTKSGRPLNGSENIK